MKSQEDYIKNKSAPSQISNLTIVKYMHNIMIIHLFKEIKSTYKPLYFVLLKH